MCDYKDLFMDIDNFDESNLVYVKPLDFYKKARSMGVYYKTQGHKREEKQKKVKIIVRSPKMRVPFNIKKYENSTGENSYKLPMSFATLTHIYNDEDIRNFSKFLKKIDSTTKNTVSFHRGKWGLPKNMSFKRTIKTHSKFPSHMVANLPHDKNYGFTFEVFDEDAKKSNIESIKQYSIISVIMELTDIKFTDSSFRVAWNIMQVRKHHPFSPIQSFFSSTCFLYDSDDPEDSVFDSLIEKYREKLSTPLYFHNAPNMMGQARAPLNSVAPPPPPPVMPECRQMTNKNSSHNNSPAQSSGFVPPSLSEILSGKKALRKVVFDTDKGCDNTDKTSEKKRPRKKKRKAKK